MRRERLPLWRLLRLTLVHKRWLVLAVLLGFATVASGVGLMATAAYIIASAALHPSVADLAVAIVGVRFFGIARGVFRYLERYVSHMVTFRLLARLRVWFYTAVEPRAPGALQDERSGDLLARVVSDVESLQQFFLRVLAPSAVAVLVAGAMWLYLRAFADVLAGTLVFFLIAAGAGLPLLARRLAAGTGRRLAATRAELAANLVDAVQGLADLAAFGADGMQLARLAALNRDLAAAQARMAWLGGLNNGLATLVANLGTWALLALAIPLVTGGAFPAVYLPVLALAALAAFEAVMPLPLAFQNLEHSLASARRLFAVAGNNLTPPPPSPRGKGELGAPPRTGEGTGERFAMASVAAALSAHNLRFRYGPGEPWALDGLDFAVPAGGHLAVVGASGAGKSTLVNLLLRFWDVEEGSLRLDGVDLRDLDPESVRGRIAVVSQHTYLFNASIRDNLLLARPDASQAEVVAASERAQLHAFVTGLSRGYDTFVGEQGLRLSGGERQRLAIARALLKDAPLLVLDEATANLDSLTEQAVLKGLRELRQGRTTITVTHRLAGLEDADEILVLSAGKVVERGRQADLVRAGGAFRRFWDLQRQTLPLEWR